MAYTVGFCTLGCRVNQYETEAIAECFRQEGFVVKNFDDVCDVYVINTCTVTSESDRKSKQMIRRARKRGGADAVVMAAGCYTQTHKADMEGLSELDFAVGNAHKTSLAKQALLLLEHRTRAFPITDIASETACEPMAITQFVNARVNLKIVDGCDNVCTYCAIPKARGHVRSRLPDDIVREAEVLSKNGYREMVLTGIETSEYGKDLQGVTLSTLTERMDNVEGVERIRYGSLDPTVIREEFVACITRSRHVMPWFHLALQNGSDRVLAAMKRRYNTGMYRQKLKLLRQRIPDVTFTTDIIVGFPGETEEDFRQTMAMVEEVGFLYVHIFPYSPREGTPAASYPDMVSPAVRKERASRLNDVMLSTRKRVIHGFLGRVMTVLVEEHKNGDSYGHTENFIEVRLSGEHPVGSIVSVTLDALSADTSYVYGSLTQQ